MTCVFGQWCFTSPEEQRRTHWETAIVCVKIWNDKIQCYIFCVCTLWCNTLNAAERNEWRRSSLYHAKGTILVNQSAFCSELAPPPLVPIAVLGTPTKGYQKVRFAILVPFTTSDNGNGHNGVPYRTVPPKREIFSRNRACKACSFYSVGLLWSMCNYYFLYFIHNTYLEWTIHLSIYFPLKLCFLLP